MNMRNVSSISGGQRMILRKGTRGFSLIEVMCAIVILGVALVGLTQGITTALGSNKESELQTTAALLAAGRIETLRAEGYLYDGVEEGECGDDLPLYQYTQNISSTSVPGLHDVQVSISNSRTGKTIYELETLIFDPSDVQDLETEKKSSDKNKKREGRKQ